MTDSSSSSPSPDLPTEAEILREENDHLALKVNLLNELNQIRWKKFIATIKVIVVNNKIKMADAEMDGDIKTVDSLHSINLGLVRAVNEAEEIL